MSPLHPDLGHLVCDPPMLWWWRRRRWPEGAIWECPVCQRRWVRDDMSIAGWTWIDDEE